MATTEHGKTAMKFTGIALSAAMFLGLGGVAAKADNTGMRGTALPANKIALGVYDPGRAFSRDGDVAIEHIFVYWQAMDMRDFRKRLAYAQSRNRTMMVTVEPYTKAANWRDGGEHLFSDIVNGKFRKEINRVCTELGKFDGSVIVRWGHEMEDPTGRYPWARHDNKGFKAAFRHFVTSCREMAPNASFVWSPKGEKNLADYYPGDAWVDYVGVSLWGLQAMDNDFFGGGRDFRATFAAKYKRVARFGKPVIIAELGVSGDGDYRKRWFADLYETVASSRAFERLRAVVYFNDKEPHHWPMGYGSPDWRIASGWFAEAKQVSTRLASAAR
jgi:endoglucanase